MLLYYLYSADRVGTSEARRNNWLKIVHGTWAAWWGRWGSAQLQTNNSLFIFIFLHIFFLPWSSVGTGGTDCRVIFSLLNKQQCLPVLCRNSGAPLWGSPITERNVTSSASLYCRFQACPFISGRHSHRQQSDLVVFTPDCFSWGNPSLGLDKVESNLEPSGGRLWFCCASCLSGSFLKQLLRIWSDNPITITLNQVNYWSICSITLIFSYMHLEILGKIHSLSVLMPYQQYCICQRATVNNLYNDTTNHKTFSNINI